MHATVSLLGPSSFVYRVRKRSKWEGKDILLSHVDREHDVDERNVSPCYAEKTYRQCIVRRERQKDKLDCSTISASPALETSSIKSAVLMTR